MRRAGEASVGDERDLVPEPFAHERRRHVQHLAHSGAACWPLVADHYDVAGVNAARLHRGEALLLRLEHACGTSVEEALVPGELHDAALGREVAAQDR